MKIIKGILRAISIESYGIYSKGKSIYEFQVKNVRLRKKIDPLQGKKVDFAKDIAPLLKK